MERELIVCLFLIMYSLVEKPEKDTFRWKGKKSRCNARLLHRHREPNLYYYAHHMACKDKYSFFSPFMYTRKEQGVLISYLTPALFINYRVDFFFFCMAGRVEREIFLIYKGIIEFKSAPVENITLWSIMSPILAKASISIPDKMSFVWCT